MTLLPVPEKLDAKKPWNVGDRGPLGMCRVSSEQPGIPARATHHLFTRRVGSPGYGRAALRAKRELPLLRKPMRGGGMLNLLGMCCSSSMKRRAHPSKGFDQSFKEGKEYFDRISD